MLFIEHPGRLVVFHLDLSGDYQVSTRSESGHKDELIKSMSLQGLLEMEIEHILTIQFQLSLYYTLASHKDQPRIQKYI